LPAFTGVAEDIFGQEQIAPDLSDRAAIREVTTQGAVCFGGCARITVGRLLKETDYQNLNPEMHMLMVDKFLTIRQAQKEEPVTHQNLIRKQHGNAPGGGK